MLPPPTEVPRAPSSQLRSGSAANKDEYIGFDGYIDTCIFGYIGDISDISEIYRIYRIYQRYIGGYFYMNIDISDIKLL